MAGRLEEAFMLVAVCPMCGKLYLVRFPEEQLTREAEAAKHGIDLSYEKKLDPHQFAREYLGEFVPAPRTTLLQLKCEQHQITRDQRVRWNQINPHVTRHTYTRGWKGADGMQYRPCPSCVKWPEAHYTEDLDEQTKYEAEKAGSQPAFGLKGRTRKGR
jgi:hypothetical protein